VLDPDAELLVLDPLVELLVLEPDVEDDDKPPEVELVLVPPELDPDVTAAPVPCAFCFESPSSAEHAATTAAPTKPVNARSNRNGMLGELVGGRDAPPSSMAELEGGREAPPSSITCRRQELQDFIVGSQKDQWPAYAIFVLPARRGER